MGKIKMFFKKFWAWLKKRNWKRHTGAVITIIPALFVLFGFADEKGEAICRIIEMVGASIWGIGWLDAVMRPTKNE